LGSYLSKSPLYAVVAAAVLVVAEVVGMEVVVERKNLILLRSFGSVLPSI
jgi:hypothetical protein